MKLDIDEFKEVLMKQIKDSYGEDELINILDFSKNILLKEIEKNE